jgi:hypothetical protein
MDYRVIAADRYITEQDEAAESACLHAAHAHGLSAEQAKNCDDGANKCPMCPWTEQTDFRHIDGDKVLAVIYDDGRKEKPFFYKDSDRDQAFQLARDYVEAYFMDKEIQQDIFSTT